MRAPDVADAAQARGRTRTLGVRGRTARAGEAYVDASPSVNASARGGAGTGCVRAWGAAGDG